MYLSIYLSIYGSRALVGLGRFFNFLILYTGGRTPLTGNQPVPRPLSTHRTTPTQNKRTQTSMPRVGFEPMIPVFERAKRTSCLRPHGECDRHVHHQYTTVSRSVTEVLLQGICACSWRPTGVLRISIVGFWDMTPCSFLGGFHGFRERYCHHVKITQNLSADGSSKFLRNAGNR
jgi:hypothetical protein